MFEKEETKDDIKWSPFTIIQPLSVPFDNPVYPWKIDDKAQFLP